MGPFHAPPQDGKTALHYAAENGLVAVMEALAAKGADLNAYIMKVRAPLGALCPWELRKGARVQRCTSTCHEMCTGMHEPPT